MSIKTWIHFWDGNGLLIYDLQEIFILYKAIYFFFRETSCHLKVRFQLTEPNNDTCLRPAQNLRSVLKKNKRSKWDFNPWPAERKVTTWTTAACDHENADIESSIEKENNMRINWTSGERQYQLSKLGFNWRLQFWYLVWMEYRQIVSWRQWSKMKSERHSAVVSILASRPSCPEPGFSLFTA